MLTTIRPIRLLMIFLLATLAFSAMAAQRDFPASTLRGKLIITDYPNVTVSGNALRLSPGSRIWNTEQLTQIPNSLGTDTYLVNYTLNPQGDIDRVWILTPDEASQKIETQRNGNKL
ncbi:hypothetical protein SAMN04515618_113124 [Collimonas sp. OK307]|uniref:hypothetical protein n=1 Tax=Collimonas sp. OK307 TaxID=1801620 RepID=UPI0008EA842F|nr:hypothetical protein [Collimonas sp. OK307]SFI20451.1 hypothetical protein SAMN04515618_113124 [Collimonas sp. OK307]